MSIATFETSLYLPMRTGRNIPPGHSRFAWNTGMAEWTPNLRASYDAADTTPRFAPPTITGFPVNSGRSACSTEA